MVTIKFLTVRFELLMECIFYQSHLKPKLPLKNQESLLFLKQYNQNLSVDNGFNVSVNLIILNKITKIVLKNLLHYSMICILDILFHYRTNKSKKLFEKILMLRYFFRKRKKLFNRLKSMTFI